MSVESYLERRIGHYLGVADRILERHDTEDYLGLPLSEFQKHHRMIMHATELSIVLQKLRTERGSTEGK